MRKYQRPDISGLPSDRQYQNRKTSESSQPSFGSGGRGDSRDSLLDRHNNRVEPTLRRQSSKQADFYSYGGSDPMVARTGGQESPGRAGEPLRPPGVDHKNRRTRFKQLKSYSLDCHPEMERDDYVDPLCPPPRRLIPKAPGESDSPRYSRESLTAVNFVDRTFTDRHESSAQNLAKYGVYNDTGRPAISRKYDESLVDKNCLESDDWDYKRNVDQYIARERSGSGYPLDSDSDRYKQPPPGILRNSGLQDGGAGKFYGGYDDQISPRSRMLPPVVEKRPEESRPFQERSRRLEGSKEIYSKMLSQLDEYYDPVDNYHEAQAPSRHRNDYGTPVRRQLPEPKM